MAETKRIALVTGAGSGIGRAVSIPLRAAGFCVVLAGRRREELERTASLAKASAGKMLAVSTDESDARSVRRLFEQIKTTYARLDVLFNDAGTTLRNLCNLIISITS
jgi:NADP-dependent 3-hydroxy acid dehydrogenase YdfG